MFILDESISAAERERLRAWRIRFRHVGETLAEYGTDDADLIPILHRLPRPTFFPHDADFWTPRLCHPAYCIVFLDVEATEPPTTSGASSAILTSRRTPPAWAKSSKRARPA